MVTGTAKTMRLDAIVLAAGASLRFGGGKLLAPWGEGVLLDGALAAAEDGILFDVDQPADLRTAERLAP